MIVLIVATLQIIALFGALMLMFWSAVITLDIIVLRFRLRREMEVK